MLHVILLIGRLEVARDCFRTHRLYLLGLHFGFALELEAFKGILVRGFGLELLRLVLGKADDGAALGSDFLQHFIVLFEFALLLLGEALFVVALSFKRQRVEWILWLLLVEDIALAVLPVRKALLVVAGAQDGFSLIDILVVLLQRWLHMVALINNLVCSVAVHFVWVDDLRFFLQVECLRCLDHKCALPVESEVLLVATQQSLRVWVPHKLICASSAALSFIAYSSQKAVRL